MTREDLTLAALLAIAVLLVAVGCALIYPPAGLLAAGALMLAVVFVYLRGLMQPPPAPRRERR